MNLKSYLEARLTRKPDRTAGVCSTVLVQATSSRCLWARQALSMREPWWEPAMSKTKVTF